MEKNKLMKSDVITIRVRSFKPNPFIGQIKKSDNIFETVRDGLSIHSSGGMKE